MSNESQTSSSNIFKGCLFSCLGATVSMIAMGILMIFIIGMITSDDSISPGSTVRQTVIQGNHIKNDGIIGVIQINGVITSARGDGSSTNCHDVGVAINSMLNQDNVKAVILRVDSPGGEVTASDIIYDYILKIKQRGIPVIVQMESIAASGGYYVSCHANHIIANPTTLTGSIGVIMTGINVEEGMGKLGIKTQVFKSGNFKDMLSATREMTEAERDYVQAMINQSYQRFVSLVSQGRNITKEKLAGMNAIDGRVISGEDALQIGLVDSLGYWDDAVDKAKELAKINSPVVIQFDTKLSFADLLFDLGLEAKAPKKISVEIGNTSFPTLKPSIPYLLPASYATGTIIQE